MAAVNGVNLHYVIAGSGPLVVLLHGFPEFWYSWRHQIEPLAQRHTVVALDQRGYNHSSKPAAVADYALEQLVEDVRALIRHLGHTHAVIVGHDWGGVVAWAFAMRYPLVTLRLAVLNLPHPRLMRKALLSNPRQMLRSWYAAAFQIPKLPEWLMERGRYGLLTRSFTSWVSRSNVFTPADLELYRQAWSQPGALTAMVNWYRAFRFSKNFYATVPEIISVPTLLIWGTADKALGQELTYGTERYVSDLRVRYLNGISHWVQQEAPDEVNALLVPFVRGEW
ncbi:MAG: alpha/beta hydrolase [Herpetosiphonaceae bacterium]|nr:alpha/beta hydrolase [Herpetosiphonaceae bacterium]